MCALAKKHLVEEQRHDLFLGKFLLNLIGEKGFAKLASKFLFARQKVITSQLLCQCAAAARNVTGHRQLRKCSQNAAIIDRSSWSMPTVFEWLQTSGKLKTTEMYRTFNCGVGMVLVIDAADETECLGQLDALGEKCWVIGEVADRGNGPSIVIT